jgi:hypothetical protein
MILEFYQDDPARQLVSVRSSGLQPSGSAARGAH